MRRKPLLLLLAVTLVGALAAFTPHLVQRAREAETRENGFALAMAAERYCMDHQTLVEWPITVRQLVDEGYLKQLPTNPYTGIPMREVPLLGRGSPGDYSYFRTTEEILPGYTVATDYRIVVYGGRPLTKRRGDPGFQFLVSRWAGFEQLDWRYVLDVFANSDGKPSNAVLRRLNAADILSGKLSRYAYDTLPENK